LMPTASARSLMVRRGWRSSVWSIRSRVLFIKGLLLPALNSREAVLCQVKSIPNGFESVNIIDKYHKYPDGLPGSQGLKSVQNTAFFQGSSGKQVNRVNRVNAKQANNQVNVIEPVYLSRLFGVFTCLGCLGCLGCLPCLAVSCLSRLTLKSIFQ
jgi:hypothetical protein